MKTDFSWFPLVLRERPPGRPLEARITELTGLAERSASATCPGRMTLASEILNKAALIASDCGAPTLAHALCWQQYALFEPVRPLPSRTIKLAIQPLLNIPRQLVREGHGDDAYAMLASLYAAARSGTSATIGGRVIDLDALAGNPEDRKTVGTLLWTALLADGTRALARAGRWREAADRVAEHHGIGSRLLDGRQAAIIARLKERDPGGAATLVEQSQVTEPWEQAVQDILRVLCRHAHDSVAPEKITAMLASASALAQAPAPATAAARARIGITALNLAGPHGSAEGKALRTSLTDLATRDAYAAHDLLSQPALARELTESQSHALRDLVRACGLRRGTIPGQLRIQLSIAVSHATATLTSELEALSPVAEPYT